MWSGPRNLSTAMMRSFGSRKDTAVWDEPFYAPYLAATGLVHPGSAETLAAHDNDPERIAAKAAGSPAGREPYWFQKHMPQHMLETFPVDWMKSCRHFMLLRDPDYVIASFAEGREHFDIDEVGFLPQAALYDRLIVEGHTVPVISSADILAAPQAMLTALCRALGIPFDPAMLSWAAGPRPEDGAWAPYWYKSVAASTGFTRPKVKPAVVPDEYASMAKACRPAYERMMALRLQA